MKDSHLTIDPTHHFPNKNELGILSECGVVPFWVGQAFEKGLSGDELMRYVVEDRYGMAGSPMTGFTLDNNFVLFYPEDPDLHPLLVMSGVYSPDVVCQYEYGWVVFGVADEIAKFTVYRMD